MAVWNWIATSLRFACSLFHHFVSSLLDDLFLSIFTLHHPPLTGVSVQMFGTLRPVLIIPSTVVAPITLYNLTPTLLYLLLTLDIFYFIIILYCLLSVLKFILHLVVAQWIFNSWINKWIKARVMHAYLILKVFW